MDSFILLGSYYNLLLSREDPFVNPLIYVEKESVSYRPFS